MIKEKKLDKDWIHLIVKAKKMGFSIAEIRMFLQQAPTYEKPIPKSGR